MTDTLQGVISTEPVEVCPREHLGFTCASPAYDCVCEDVGTCVMEVEQDTRGPVAVLSLYLLPGLTEWSGVRKRITMSGNYRADWKVSLPTDMFSGLTVEARWDLWRPENRGLRDYLAGV